MRSPDRGNAPGGRVREQEILEEIIKLDGDCMKPALRCIECPFMQACYAGIFESKHVGKRERVMMAADKLFEGTIIE